MIDFTLSPETTNTQTDDPRWLQTRRCDRSHVSMMNKNTKNRWNGSR